MMLTAEHSLTSSYLLKALTSIYPNAPRIFGLDGSEVGPEEIILKIASRFASRLHSYIYVCYVLRIAADMMDGDGLGNRVPSLLRLQELVSP